MGNKRGLFFIIILVIVLILLNVIFIISFNQKSSTMNSDDFSVNIDNKYFSLVPRTNFIYEAETDEGLERIEVYVTEDTKRVQGVKTRVVWDRVWLDGELIEDTKDWYAQDKQGNVWYFGEDSKELVLGNVVSTKGSWEAGIDGAQPGIIMKANLRVGEIYQQEYSKGVAEDMAEILALGERVNVPYRTFSNCLKTKEWNPLELTGDEENRYYCSSIGTIVLEESIESGERVELIEIQEDVSPIPQITKRLELKTNITKKQAQEIALIKVPGTITDTDIEIKFGKPTYVVEIDSFRGIETDVIIDIQSGNVLSIET